MIGARPAPSRKGHGDSRERDQHRGAAMFPHVPAFKFQTHEKQQEDEPDLRDDREDLRDRGIGEGLLNAFQMRPEDHREEIGGQPAEQRRAEEQTRDNLADHRGLPNPASECPEEPRHRDDDDELNEDRQEQRFGIEVGKMPGRFQGAICRGLISEESEHAAVGIDDLRFAIDD